MRKRVLQFALFCAPAFAAGVAPCTDGSAGELIIALRNSRTTYCTSAFGWSDTWFRGSQATYNQQADVFSGEDSFNLRWTGMTGAGWLSPSMDNGTTVPNLIGSQWGILTDIAYTVVGQQNQTFSRIGHANGLQIDITTTLTNALLDINFVIRNTSTTNTVSNLVLSDYFNFHPNGSLHSNQSTRQGTTRYLANCPAHIGTCNGVIYTTGNQSLSTFVSQGFVYGQRAPDAYATGYASGMPTGQQALFTQMANGVFNNQAGPVGPADSAGALAYNLGNLAPGQQTAFTFYKGLDVPTPEPAAWVMMSLGLILLILRARRQRKQNLELARLRSRMDCVKQV